MNEKLKIALVIAGVVAFLFLGLSIQYWALNKNVELQFDEYCPEDFDGIILDNPVYCYKIEEDGSLIKKYIKTK